MKRILSTFMAAVIVISAVIPMSICADEIRLCPGIKQEISTKISKGADYIMQNGLTTGLSTLFDTYTLFRAGVADGETFLNEVEQNLSENDGKIVVYGSENVSYYACIIDIMNILSEDSGDFRGYDINSLFLDCTYTAVDSPYYYRAVIEACINLDNRALADKYCNDFINEYYTLGKGMNYWGYSCDNTASFLASIAPCKEDFSEYVSDAVSIIEHYTTHQGCFYSDEYTDASPDSTASAIMAYASIGDYDSASVLYNILYGNFENSDLEGVIDYYGGANAYSTKNAVLALTYINGEDMHKLNFSSKQEATCKSGTIVTYMCKYCGKGIRRDDKRVNADAHSYNAGTVTKKATCLEKGEKTRTCKNCGSVKKEKTAKLGHSYKTKTVAPTYFEKGYKLHTCSRCGYSYKDNSKAKLVLSVPGIKKLSSSKNSVTVKYGKNSNASGYQIKYSTSSSFKNSKTVKVTKNSTTSKKISKLKANKKYYFRVRAYKVKNGKYVYSSWSKTKSIKTKK